MLVLAPQKNSTFDFLKFKGGLFAGNAINKDTKTLRDFIGTLTAQKNIGSDGQWELGASLYEGGVFQGNKNVYTMSGNAFKCDSTASNYGDYAKREYIGFDGNIAYEMPFGMTKLTAEYVFGKQPATSSSTKSPNASTNPTGDTYIRNFSGYYIMLVQDLGASPFSLVAKYDFYDPNTDVDGDNVGKNKTSKVDLNKTTIGLGAIWRASNSLKFTAFYDINKNEKTANVKGYDKDLKDNVFTLRMQYNF
jgi:hypothetical protein